MYIVFDIVHEMHIRIRINGFGIGIGIGIGTAIANAVKNIERSIK